MTMTREEAIAKILKHSDRWHRAIYLHVANPVSEDSHLFWKAELAAFGAAIAALREPGEPEAKPPAWDGEAFERAITEAAFEELKRPGMIREQSQRIAHRARELAEKGMGGK